ncbi:MAG: hypothetical protein WCW40_00140 [Bacteroidota bacterium]
MTAARWGGMLRYYRKNEFYSLLGLKPRRLSDTMCPFGKDSFGAARLFIVFPNEIPFRRDGRGVTIDIPNMYRKLAWRIFIKYEDAELPLCISAFLNPAKTESQTAGHPVQLDFSSDVSVIKNGGLSKIKWLV